MSPKTLWKDPLHDYKYGAVHESGSDMNSPAIICRDCVICKDWVIRRIVVWGNSIHDNCCVL